MNADRRTGLLLIIAAAFAFSTAGLFTRLIAVDAWTILFWRGMFGGAFIFAGIALTQRARLGTAFAAIGWAGIYCTACSAFSTIAFIHALRLTSVADVLLINATAPFIAAAFGWALTRERQRRSTLLAAFLALGGVGVMMNGAYAHGNLLGDLLALLTVALFASMMVVMRARRDVSMLPATCLSAFAAALLVLPLAQPLQVSASEFGVLALFGTMQFGLGLLLLTVGMRMVSATQAALWGNLELPVAPLLVWIGFGEVPPPATWFGGAIVLAAVAIDMLGERRQI